MVVLAAEPTYVLVDTAVVGHLGRTELGALALGGAVLTVAAWLGTVFAYGTTARAARRFGAGQRAAAVAEGVQGSWLALAAGLVIVLVLQVGGPPLTRLMAGGEAGVAEAAADWLRVASLGVPGLLLATVGNGWMRGVQDTRRPLFFVLGACGLSALLCPLLVYPFGLGLVGSAVANAVAQTVSGVLFARALFSEKVSLRPDPAVLWQQVVLGRDLVVRGAAMQGAFLGATTVAAGFGAAALGGHQIALQLWMFTALAQDAVAIAAQSLVGAELGGGRVAGAKAVARRVAGVGLVTGFAFAAVIGAGAPFLPQLFSPDPLVHAQAWTAWPWFAAMQPAAGVVFALDGVLLGAGDAVFLRNLTIAAALGAYLPGALVARWLDLGLGGVWAALTLFILVRLVAMLWRVRSGRWAVVGASR
ncbi:MATE family efflux transporter [Virgisporangium aliadipatigenens]|uniref:MATE family efflux transporter n=1 Tax=Virgisporangium aliadipatigenens TaxID=741659 RepID=A0A8J3YKY4_9ACTN|nr:MATE family efflux transporter [Virgisporangium aliadipatigenens]